MLNVLNPATGETIAEVPVSAPEDVDRAVGVEDYTVVKHVMASLS